MHTILLFAHGLLPGVLFPLEHGQFRFELGGAAGLRLIQPAPAPDVPGEKQQQRADDKKDHTRKQHRARKDV